MIIIIIIIIVINILLSLSLVLSIIILMITIKLIFRHNFKKCSLRSLAPQNKYFSTFICPETATSINAFVGTLQISYRYNMTCL